MAFFLRQKRKGSSPVRGAPFFEWVVEGEIILHHPNYGQLTVLYPC